jgi:hypothetical protein
VSKFSRLKVVQLSPDFKNVSKHPQYKRDDSHNTK